MFHAGSYTKNSADCEPSGRANKGRRFFIALHFKNNLSMSDKYFWKEFDIIIGDVGDVDFGVVVVLMSWP